jgi:hypothetical protein
MSRQAERDFHRYNRLYFGGRLPRLRVRWTKNLERLQFGEFQGGTIKAGRQRAFTGVISLADWMKPYWQVWQMTLLHEMVHAKLHGTPGEHTPAWQREMRRLARAGAFDKLW